MTGDAVLIDAIDLHFGGPGAPRRIGVAVSGGSDSLALLNLLHDWRQGELSVATVDHGLRPEAADEASEVARICTDLGVPHVTLRWRGWDGKGNLQDHARRNRYRLLAEWGQETGLEAVCLGHTLDDQAETFLMRLARSSGLDGLSGMSRVFERHGMRFDRPLISARRTDLRDYLARKGLTWIEDPSNEDDAFARIRAREALKALEPLGITPESIDISATNLNLSRIALGETLKEIALKTSRVTEGDVIFDRTALMQQNPEVQRKLLAGALRWVATEDYAPRRDAMFEARKAISAGRNHSLHGCLLLVTDMTVRITREFNSVASVVSRTDTLWDQRWTLRGPHAPELEVRALGDALSLCEGWREVGCPRQSLLASPAIWQGERLLAAPVAGLPNGWSATAPGRDEFAASLLTR